jgi:hypothetical protein
MTPIPTHVALGNGKDRSLVAYKAVEKILRKINAALKAVVLWQHDLTLSVP